MSDQRGAWTVESLRDVASYGSVVIEPSYHLTRFVASFTREDRVKLLDAAIDMRLFGDERGSNEQHVALVLSGLDDPCVYDESGKPIIDPKKIDIRYSPSKKMYQLVSNGSDPYNLAKFFVNTLFSESFPSNDEVNDLLWSAFGHRVLSAKQAILLHTCVTAGLAQVVHFEEEATEQLEDVKLVPLSSFTKNEQENVEGEKASLKAVLWAASHLRKQHLVGQAEGMGLQESLLSHGIALEKGSAVLEPRRKPKLVIAGTVVEAERIARGEREAVFDQSPREFELFCANLFRRLGWEVELTKASRDGGVDLLLLRSLTGVPMRWGVEIKRYKNKPITVDHVRSFYGANQVHKASQLVYITTSRYTQPAIDFSNQCAPVTLDLKTFQHLQEWARDAYG